MKFKENQVQTADIRVTYIDEGNVDSTPLIFIHGFPFNKLMWENQIEVFKHHTRVLAYDVRGFGNTEPGAIAYSIDQFGRDLFHFMDALKIEKAVVCGLSMGGYIALHAIEQHPERIVGVILADTQCSADTAEAKQKRIDTIASIREKGLLEYTQDSLKKLFSDLSFTNKKEAIIFIEHTIRGTRIETVCNTLQALADRAEKCSFLDFIAMPVLIVVGEHDIVTPPEASKKIQARIAGSVLHIVNHAAHMSNLENAASFNLAMLRFLKNEIQKIVPAVA